jgi:hypothetical protein
LKKATSYFCRIEKLGAPKNIDPKAKVTMTDFMLDTPEIKAVPADSFEGVELGVSIRFEPSSMADSRSILYINSNEGGEVIVIFLVSMPVTRLLHSALA